MTSQNISLWLPGCHGNQTCLQNIQIIPRLLPFMLPNEPQIFIKHSLLCSILAWEFLPLKLILMVSMETLVELLHDDSEG